MNKWAKVKWVGINGMSHVVKIHLKANISGKQRFVFLQKKYCKEMKQVPAGTFDKF